MGPQRYIIKSSQISLSMVTPIDIFVTAYLRPKFTLETIRYLKERTTTPYRLILINNGGSEEAMIEYANDFFLVIDPSYNVGIHAAWQISLALAQSDYFITTDNDIYVPDWRDVMRGETHETHDWLGWLIKFMDERPDYGAISMQPHVTIGAVGIDSSMDVQEVNMAGAVMRIMRRNAVWQAGGWERVVRTGRNHEERTICSRLKDNGWKVGRTGWLRCYHPFGRGEGGNWGYPPEFTPEMQGHNPELKDYVLSFDNPESYDSKTWLPK